MIIQCPSCNTNFFLDEKKFIGTPKKLKCSRCSFVWTSSPNGKPLSVPLYPARDWDRSVIPEKTKSVCVMALNLPPKVSVSNHLCLLYTSDAADE